MDRDNTRVGARRAAHFLAAFALLAALCGALFGVGALGIDSVSNFSVEQTYVNVPELDLFFYALDADGNSISPTLARAAGVTLELGGHPLDSSNISMAAEPICYTFMLDNGASMDEAAFAAYKQAILQVARTKEERDQVVVYTMAGTPQKISGESATLGELYHALQDLPLSADTCDLLSSARQVYTDTNANYQSLAPRKVLIVCTSGVEVLSNPALVAGLGSDLVKNLNMALYAFAATEKSGHLTALSTLTGGKVIPCATEDLVGAVRQKQADLANALEIKTTVPDSMGGERLDLLTLSVPALGSAVSTTTTVYMGHMQDKPAVSGISVDGRTQLTVTFNQAVDNADSPRSYTIHSEDAWGWYVKVKSVAVAEDGRTAVLTTEPLYRGQYSIRLNKVASRLTAANQSGKTKAEFPVADWAHDRAFYMARFKMPALVLLTLLAVLAVQTFRQTRRDRVRESAAEVEHLLTGESVGIDLPKRWISLYITPRGAIAEKRYAALIEGSALLGTDERLCDICLTDHRVRPQHCALYIEDGELYLRPLDNSCAVVYNNSRLVDAHRLQNNDVFRIGRTTVRVAL